MDAGQTQWWQFRSEDVSYETNASCILHGYEQANEKGLERCQRLHMTRGRPASRLDGFLMRWRGVKGEEFLGMDTWRAEAEVHLDLVMSP